MRLAGKIFQGVGSFRDDGFDAERVGAEGRVVQAEDEAATFVRNAEAADASMKSASDIAAAEHWADATRVQGANQGQQALVGGFADGVSSIAGGIFKSKGSGASNAVTPRVRMGNYSEMAAHNSSRADDYGIWSGKTINW